MSALFESSEIAGMRLSNRFVRSATWEGLAWRKAPLRPDSSTPCADSPGAESG